MFWSPPGKGTDDNADRGVRELRKSLGEALVTLSAAENQLAICIERVKEIRTVIEHDEMLLREILASLYSILKNKVIGIHEFHGLRKGVKDIKKSLMQSHRNLMAARTNVDKAEDLRDDVLAKVNSLKKKIESYRTVLPWKKTK